MFASKHKDKERTFVILHRKEGEVKPEENLGFGFCDCLGCCIEEKEKEIVDEIKREVKKKRRRNRSKHINKTHKQSV